MSQTDPPQPPSAPYGAPTTAVAPHGEHPPKKKSLLSRWWFWAIIAVALIVVVSAINAGGGSTEQPVDEGTSQPPAPEEEPEDVPEETAPGIGDTVTTDGFEITVVSVETGVASVGNEFLNEDAQGAFTLVSVTVKNTGNSAETVFSASFTLRDAQAREFDASSTASVYLGDTGFAFEKINPGNTASGILVFDLPAGVSPQALEFSANLFGRDSVLIDLS